METGKYGDQEAKRILKLLFQIADSLEENKLVEIYKVLNGILESSTDGDEKVAQEHLRRFYDLVTFKAGISVSLCKQGMRSLLMIKADPNLGKLVLDPVRQKVAEKFPDLAAMGKLDDKTLDIYIKALEGQNETLNHIRLMVVGMYGVGKTCLVRRLRGEPINDVVSTVGIEINVKVCALNEDGTWINQTVEEGKANELDKRAQDVMVQQSNEMQNDLPTIIKESVELPPPATVQQKAPVRHPVIPPREQTRTVPHVAKEPKVNPLDNTRKTFDARRKQKGAKRYMETIESVGKSGGKMFSKRKPTVSIWDFAGQSVYYSTHQFFLSSRSIYLLVLDISKPLETIVNEEQENGQLHLLKGAMKKDYTCLDAFKFWVTSIYTYTQYKTTKDQEQYKPTIVLVGTHGDRLKGDRKERESLKDEYFENAREYFVDSPADELFYGKTFLVSCTEDEKNVFDDLKANITKIAKDQPYWGKTTPARWIPLELSIELEKENQKALMKLSELNVVNEDNEYVLPKEEIKLFLETLHFRGQVIYFDAQDLDETVILNPQWLVDIFKLFVTHQPFIPPEVRGLWIDYKRTAKLNKKLLHAIIELNDKDAGSDNSRFGEKEKELVRYMEHLDVIAKPMSDAADAADVDFHIVPCVLKQLKEKGEDCEMVRNELYNQKGRKSTPVLCFVYNLRCLPQSVYHRLMATYIRSKKIITHGNDYLLYNGFGAFNLKGTRTLCIWYADFIIHARVTLNDTKNDFLSTDECILLREELSNIVDKILRQDNPSPTKPADGKSADASSAFTMHILCEKQFLERPLHVLQSTNKPDMKVGLYSVEQLKNETSISCSCHVSKSDKHVIESKEALKYWFREPDYLQPFSEWFRNKEKQDEHFLQQLAEDAYIEDLTKWLTENDFDELVKLLKIPISQVKLISESKTNSYGKILELLQKWLKEEERTNKELKDTLYLVKERQNTNKKDK